MRYKTKKLSLNNKIFENVKSNLKGNIIRLDIYSHILNNHRNIDVYLPPSYFKNPNKRYPVVYMHDGNNLFYHEIAFGNYPWKADKTVDKLINTALIEEVIVVGIHNTMGRNYEYTWHEMSYRNGFREGGGGDKYAKFIIHELKQSIDSKFRTLSDKNNTSVIGSSLGGLISFYLGLYYPNVFGKIGIMSPSFWWANARVLNDVKHLSHDLKIWLDMGTKEGGKVNGENPNLVLTSYMKHELHKKGYAEGYNLGYLEDRGGKHNEHHWGQRLHIPLIFFFGKRHSLIFSKT